MLGSELVKIASVTAMVSLAFSTLIVISQKWHGKLSHDHDLDGVQKVHTTAVPRIGGIAVVASILGAAMLVMGQSPGVISDGQAHELLLLLICSIPAFFAGIAEDITKRVSVKVRLFATFCSSMMASALLGATVNDLDIWGVDALLTFTPFAVLITSITVAGGANAINIIDGFNGLSSSVIAIMSAALGLVAWQAGDNFVAMLGAFGVGAAFGFLLLNYPSGKLFLGDGGAYFFGFWVAEMAVLLLVRRPEVNAWQLLAICAYPVIEVLFSIYRRRFVKKVDPGAPDALHLHTLVFRRVVSRFVPSGGAHPWSRNAAVTFVMVPWLFFAALLAVVFGGTIVGGIAVVAIQVMAYIAVYGRLVRGRWFSRAAQPLAVKVLAESEEEELLASEP
jgi:UDP-N-acetylmuramyl pentapeptide phosphotransferase/UDP-N-acetylglucosamine-1-phosphate transferase